MCLDDILHAEDRVDLNVELPALEIRYILGKLIPQPTLVLHVAAPQRAALEPDALEQQHADVDALEPRAAQEPKHDPARVPRGDGQILLEVARADEVDDEVDAPAARGLEDAARPVVRLVVEGPGGAELGLDEAALVVAADGGVDGGGAGVARQLDAGDADAAGARVPEDRLAGGELADEVQRLRRRHEGLGDPGRLLEGEERGLAEEEPRVDGYVLGVGAAVREAEDGVALV